MLDNSEIDSIHLADKTERDIVFDVLFRAFINDPCVNWIVGPSKNKDKLSALLHYILDESFCRGKVYLTNDNFGAALWLTEKPEVFTLHYIWRNVFLWLQNGSKSVRRAILMQNLSHKNFPKKEKFTYLYMIGVLPEKRGQGLAGKLLDPILAKNRENRTPVFLDTSNPHNVAIYKKKGFDLIKTYEANEIKIYFMKYAINKIE